MGNCVPDPSVAASLYGCNCCNDPTRVGPVDAPLLAFRHYGGDPLNVVDMVPSPPLLTSLNDSGYINQALTGNPRPPWAFPQAPSVALSPYYPSAAPNRDRRSMSSGPPGAYEFLQTTVSAYLFSLRIVNEGGNPTINILASNAQSNVFNGFKLTRNSLVQLQLDFTAATVAITRTVVYAGQKVIQILVTQPTLAIASSVSIILDGVVVLTYAGFLKSAGPLLPTQPYTLGNISSAFFNFPAGAALLEDSAYTWDKNISLAFADAVRLDIMSRFP